MRESEQKYRTLLEQAADGIVVADPDRSIVTVNSRACEIFGYRPDEFVGRDLFGLLHPAEVPNNPPRIAEVRSGSTVINERSLRRKDGSYIPAETSTKQLEDGRVQVIIRDITERKLAEEALRRSEREYRNLFESANDAIILFDAATEEIVDLNRRAIDFFGAIGSAQVGGSLRELIGDAAMEQLKRGARNVDDGVQGVEAVIRHPGGTRMDLIINASYVGFRGRPVVLSIHRDVTPQKELERQLAHQALHDRLTGLANRALFEDRMAHALARAREDSTDVAILMLDLDRFKLVNETLGHDVGDRMLIGVADRLSRSVREGDTVARLGGDEYTILLENVANMREVTLVAERISNILQTPHIIDGHEIVVTASIGIVIGSGGRGTPEDLLRNADVAMYRAKDAGRRRYVVFDPSMNATMLERLKLEADLRQAITRDELRVYFQPAVELDTGRIIGLEALVRWKHPTRGLIAPSEFIPLAEETGLIRLIDQFVLSAACSQIAVWTERYPGQHPVVLNVNLSAQGFQHPELVQDISQVLVESGIDARNVQLEITESVIMTDATATHQRLQQLKELGVRLAIDDFGTGYSSLSYLKRFPVDTLKIDKAFVDGLGSDAEDTAIVEAVISLSRALGLKVIAEGIESEPAVRRLQQLGCTLGQGYYFSRPQPAEAFEELWANGLNVRAGWKPPESR